MANHHYGQNNPEFRRRSQNCRVDRETNDVILRLHETDIVRVRPNGDVVLSTGGWATHKTLHSMNDALELFDMYVEAAGNPPRGDWHVIDTDGSVTPYLNNKVNYVITIPAKGAQASQRARRLAEGYNIQYTPARQQQQQQQGPRIVSAPPRPQAPANTGGARSSSTAAAAAGAASSSRAVAANGVHGSSWANVAAFGSPPVAAHAAAATPPHARRMTGPGAAASSAAAAPAAAPAGLSSNGSHPQQGGMRALDVARNKLQQAAAHETRPVEEQLEEHMKKLGIQAEELEDDTHTCVVCMDQPRVTVLVPCGHMALCRDCCKLLIEDKKNAGEEAACPMCCQSVDYHVEVDS